MEKSSRNIVFPIILALISLWGVYNLGVSNGDPNKSPVYGDSGAPKNCRAIVHENYKQYFFKEVSAEDALASINRNCGGNGSSWEK